MFHDFYRFTTWRSISNTIPYSSAFPPLWPAINAIVAGVLQMGPLALVLSNAIVLVLFVLAAAGASRAVFGSASIGLVSVLLIFTDPTWTDELLSGRSIPLQVTLVAGLLCELMVLNRFDALPFVATVGLSLCLTSDRRLVPIFVLCAASMSLPWMIYSLVRFGIPFVTDNRFVAATTDRAAFVTDWRESWAPLVWDDPGAWFSKILGNLGPLMDQMEQSQTTWAVSLGGLLVAAALALLFRRRREPIGVLPVRSGNAILVVGLSLVAMVPAYLMTGYADGRYFSRPEPR